MGAGELKMMRCERARCALGSEGRGVVRLRSDGRRERRQTLRESRETLSSTGWRGQGWRRRLYALVDLLAASRQARPPASQGASLRAAPTHRRRALRRAMGAEMVPDFGDSARKMKIPCIRTYLPEADSL